jgi:hypothetical protein
MTAPPIVGRFHLMDERGSEPPVRRADACCATGVLLQACERLQENGYK